jgi:hypothetical protein
VYKRQYKNQEIVWLREQEVLEEEKKVALLKKELAEERSREELDILRGNRSKRKKKMEWMYSNATTTNSIATIDQEKEDYLLGKKRIDPNALEKPAEVYLYLI